MLAPADFIHQRQLLGFVSDPQCAEPAYWEGAQEPAPADVQPTQQAGTTFGSFLALGTTLLSAAVLFDPKASQEAKFVAQTALSVSLPFVLSQAFGLQAWPGQVN